MKIKIILDIKNNKLTRIPIEYLIKHKNFYENKININFPALISRNESIIIIKVLKKNYNKYFLNKIFELGFGSGTIYEPIKKEKKIKYTSVDNVYINSKNQNKKKFLFHSDWFDFLNSKKKQDIIVTNPPYISIEEIKHCNIKFESKNSLISCQNGLKDIFEIIKYSNDITKKNSSIIIEHGYSQGKKTRKILKICGYNNIYTHKDFKKLQRLSRAEK